jgi:hypothetical protein
MGLASSDSFLTPEMLVRLARRSKPNRIKLLTIFDELLKQTEDAEDKQLYGQFHIDVEVNAGQLGLIGIQPCKFTIK